MHARFLSVAAILSAVRLVADGPADNRVDSVRRIPPPGVVIADEARKELTDRVGQLGTEIGKLREFRAAGVNRASLGVQQAFADTRSLRPVSLV